MTAMAPDVFTDGPGKVSKIVIWQNGGATERQCRWGLKPFGPGGHSYSMLRSEGRAITNPCLIIAHEFFVTPDESKKRYRVSYVTDEPFFCFAGVYQPESADWPAAFAALTVESSPDIAPLKDRHMAVVRPDDWQDWLLQARPVEELLSPHPLGSFTILAPNRRGAATDLFAR
jgi:putative SOS response-associated peptidase YedK